VKQGLALALTRLVARVHLVDDENAALATYQAVGAVTADERAERILDFHDGRS
jgi:alpha-D-ribose 1-methylphosphonate 5-triphosphate synthase subunit PhnI